MSLDKVDLWVCVCVLLVTSYANKLSLSLDICYCRYLTTFLSFLSFTYSKLIYLKYQKNIDQIYFHVYNSKVMLQKTTQHHALSPEGVNRDVVYWQFSSVMLLLPWVKLRPQTLSCYWEFTNEIQNFINWLFSTNALLTLVEYS